MALRTLILATADSFREYFPNEFRFDGTRALVFRSGEPLPHEALAHCVEAALTDHRRKRGRARTGRPATE
jgi:hypothetical protein